MLTSAAGTAWTRNAALRISEAPTFAQPRAGSSTVEGRQGRPQAARLRLGWTVSTGGHHDANCSVGRRSGVFWVESGAWQGRPLTRPLVPVHLELAAALRLRLDYGGPRDANAKLIGVGRQQGSRWITQAVKRAVDAGMLAPGRRVTSHTLRHSYARHLLTNGIPLNVLSRWMGHSNLDSTLIYLAILPDPTGSLAAIP